MVFGFDFVADPLAFEVVNVFACAAIVFKFYAAVICRYFDAVIKPIKMGSFGHRVQVVGLVLNPSSKIQESLIVQLFHTSKALGT